MWRFELFGEHAMGLRRAGYAVVFVILLCTLSIGGSDVKREIEVTFFSNGDSPGTNGNKLEHIRIHCRKELIDRKETLKELELSILHEITRDIIPAFSTNGNIDRSLRVLPPHVRQTVLDCLSILCEITRDIIPGFSKNGNIDRSLRVLPPQVRQTVLDCLRRKSLLFHGPRKGACSENGIINCVEWLVSWPNVPRRYLVGKSSRQKPPSLAPAPAPIPASTPPRSGLAPYNQVPASSPPPSPGLPLGALEDTSFSTDINDRIAPPSPHKSSPPVHHVVPQKSPKKHDSSQKEKIVFITATATGVLASVALLLLCCLKGSNKKNGNGKRDERPLLFLSMSDFSAGSSQNSVSPGNSSRKDFSFDSGKSPFFINMSLKHGNNVPSGAPASEGAEPAPFPPLKLPPGRSAPLPPAPPSTQRPPPPPPAPAPQPPPPSKVGRPPPAPPRPSGRNQPSFLGPHRQGNNVSSEGCDVDGESEAPKTKLKPFFWDKVLANPDQSMVWHEISSGSFQFNEEMIESLFGYTNMDKKKIERKKDSTSLEPSTQYIRIIDPKKAQNLSILLRALNVTTEEVITALQEGNELPIELLQTLLKMAPTTEEELKLRLFSGDLSQLGPAERFLKVLVDFPLAFKRIESLLFMSSVREEVSTVKESLETLEVASKKLKSSRLFLKLLEAVLKTGNRMNVGTYRGGAQAFKLDTLLKLSDVKGTDGKTTLLHFVVQEIIRSEGIRAVRTARASQSTSSMKTDDFVEESTEESAEHYRNVGLQVVSGLSGELEDVKKAAFIDADSLTATVSKLNQSMKKTKDFLNAEMKNLDEESEFHRGLGNFVECMEADISRLLEEEKRIMALVKSSADYFHGKAGKDEGLRLFAIVRDFLRMLDKACKEVRDAGMKTLRTSKKEAPSASSCSKEIHQQSSDKRQRLFPAIVERRMDDSSSDDESPSTL